VHGAGGGLTRQLTQGMILADVLKGTPWKANCVNGTSNSRSRSPNRSCACTHAHPPIRAGPSGRGRGGNDPPSGAEEQPHSQAEHSKGSSVDGQSAPGGSLIRAGPVAHPLDKGLEVLVDLVAPLPLPLLLLNLVGVVPAHRQRHPGVSATGSRSLAAHPGANRPRRHRAAGAGGKGGRHTGGASHGAAAAVDCLHDVHDLRVELHVLRLLLAQHDGVVQVEVDHCDHLVLRRLHTHTATAQPGPPARRVCRHEQGELEKYTRQSTGDEGAPHGPGRWRA
jgi:hypothetical protein